LVIHQLAKKYKMIQDEFTGLFYDPTAITNNLNDEDSSNKKNSESNTSNEYLKSSIMENTKISTTEIHHIFLWIYNWTQDDFRQAFKTSHLGWEYQWNKFQNNLVPSKGSSSAIIETVLNMDDLHQTLLFDYVLNKKYSNNIKSMDENKRFMENWEPAE